MADALLRQFGQSDLFFVYRKLLIIICSVYTTVMFAQALGRWINFLFQSGRSRQMFRDYLVLHLLRIRVHRFVGDYVQIAALVAVLVIVVWLHEVVLPSSS